ncbi:hypothetical protein E2562_003675 [Oryza meyeriana var. granulata]|uniref:Uncharacterized protein n=1 Tax=Oryza meyeriana var. granulata TaxID=110450 RepID=A0A6G1C440_9ORYZ|nr:hypothetical protein E2562_003675 [Oryza meyeriana var. granulata]
MGPPLSPTPVNTSVPTAPDALIQGWCDPHRSWPVQPSVRRCRHASVVVRESFHLISLDVPSANVSPATLSHVDIFVVVVDEIGAARLQSRDELGRKARPEV